MLIALVEDNADFRDDVAFHLGRAGHEVFAFDDGRPLDDLLATRAVDMLVLDLGLPGEDGISIARRTRSRYPDLGIVVLTARGLIDDRLRSLETGADVYLAKPVDMRELLAVLQNLSKRLSKPLDDGSAWQFDRLALTVTAPDGSVCAVTHAEGKILERLIGSAPYPVPRAQLAEALGYDARNYDFRRLETLISRLRRKIEMDGRHGQLIRAARGAGYVFCVTARIRQDGP